MEWSHHFLRGDQKAQLREEAFLQLRHDSRVSSSLPHLQGLTLSKNFVYSVQNDKEFIDLEGTFSAAV